MKIYGYGQDALDMSTRKYRILYIATPIHDLSDIKEGDKLIVRAVFFEPNGCIAGGDIKIKSDIRGLHKEE